MGKVNEKIQSYVDDAKTFNKDDVVSRLKRLAHLLGYNLIPLLLIEVVYTFASTCIFVPLFSKAFRAIIDSSGLEALTIDTIPQFFSNPLTVLCLIALVLVICVYAFLEISASVFAFDCSRQNIKVSFWGIAAFSIKNAARILIPKNFLIVIVCFVMTPLIGIGVSSSFLSNISIPSSIVAYITDNAVLTLILLVCVVVGLFFAMRWMYAVHFFTLEKTSFVESIKRSAHLNRSHRLQNLFSSLLLQAAIALINSALIFLGTRSCGYLLTVFNVAEVPDAIVVSILYSVFLFAISFMGLVSIPIAILKISGNFYNLKERNEQQIVDVACKPIHRSKAKRVVLTVVCSVVAVLAVALFTCYLYATANNISKSAMENLKRPDVIAYHAGWLSAPSNTLVAMQAAIDAGADKIEIDAQVTKDGYAILAEKSNLAVMSDLQMHVSEATYDQVANAQLRVLFAAGNSQAFIPTLEQAIACAKGAQIPLVVNVSGISEYNQQGVSIVANTIAAAGYLDSCEIASENYDDLWWIKQNYPSLQTVFIMGVSFGIYASYSAVDAFAIESSFITPEVVSEFEAVGSKVYAWNTESENAISNAISSKVDAIVAPVVEKAVELADRRGLDDVSYLVFSSTQNNVE